MLTTFAVPYRPADGPASLTIVEAATSEHAIDLTLDMMREVDMDAVDRSELSAVALGTISFVQIKLSAEAFVTTEDRQVDLGNVKEISLVIE